MPNNKNPNFKEVKEPDVKWKNLSFKKCPFCDIEFKDFTHVNLFCCWSCGFKVTTDQLTNRMPTRGIFFSTYGTEPPF